MYTGRNTRKCVIRIDLISNDRTSNGNHLVIYIFISIEEVYYTTLPVSRRMAEQSSRVIKQLCYT